MATPVSGLTAIGGVSADCTGAADKTSTAAANASHKRRDFCRAADIVVAEIAPNRMLAVIIADTQ
jgi:hypothetical protein